jgi:hypothetical protein
MKHSRPAVGPIEATYRRNLQSPHTVAESIFLLI